MKILLIVPTHNYSLGYPSFLSFSDFPSGYGYLASALKEAGHEVYGCNPNNIVGYVNAFQMIQDIISKRIAEVEPDLIGLGGICTDYGFLRDAIGVIRHTDIPIVLGGQIVTNDAEWIFNDLRPDYAIVGEGEEAMVGLTVEMQIRANPMGKMYRYCPNLWYHDADGNSAFSYTDYKYKSIDSLPSPDYEPFGIQEMMEEYSMATRVLYRYSRPNPRPYNIVASRSCPFTCTFCVHHRRGIPYRARSIQNVMEEIKVSYEKYHFNIVILLDELFGNKKRLVEFSSGVLEGMERYGWDFDWMFQTHANAKFDLESLKLAKKAGCYLFSYGLESASPTVLKSMNKKMDVSQVGEVIRIAQEAGVGFAANLIFGDIAETPDTIAESLEFWFKYGRRSDIFVGEVKPYPGSKLFDMCRKRGLFADKRDYYEHITNFQVNMTTMTDEVYNALVRLSYHIDSQWLFVKSASDVQSEKESTNGSYRNYQGGAFFTIKANCPYCGGESVYRELVGETPFWLGTGCTKCNKKMKVEVG